MKKLLEKLLRPLVWDIIVKPYLREHIVYLQTQTFISQEEMLSFNGSADALLERHIRKMEGDIIKSMQKNKSIKLTQEEDKFTGGKIMRMKVKFWI